METHSLLHYKSSGLPFPESKREHPFDRLPEQFRKKVRKEVWDLSKNTSGISLDFSTNSSFIELHWEVLNNFAMNHMPNTGIKGLDLYIKSKNQWHYVGTGIPESKQNKHRVIQNMKPENRDYRIYLPLYDGIQNLEVGLENGSNLKEIAKSQHSKSIIFYGTSITQGGCASRPGASHTNIISRETNLECLNFGFSGNGRLEKNIGEIISQLDARLYIIECMQNIEQKTLQDKLIPLIKLIRKVKKEIPIVLVNEPMFKNEYLDIEVRKNLIKKNQQLKSEYVKLKSLNISNIYLFDEPHAIGIDDEGTVDGVHFNDLGFQRYAYYILKNLKKSQLI